MSDSISYDVFLSHHSADKPDVERLARRLVDEENLRPFLDIWHLVPGEPWQEALEAALDASNACADFHGALHANESELHLQVSLALRDAPPERHLCLVIDQFEEVFTLCQDRVEQKRFADLLHYAATVAEGRTVVVLTMRADFLVRAAAYAPLGDALSSHQFLVPPMVEAELRSAIEEPARLAGVACEDGLVDTILQDMGQEPGALPLMEHALARMWEHVGPDRRLTLQAYRAVGGVQGALSQRAEALFDALTAEEQDNARRILLRLTQPGEGTEDTRRRAAQKELITRPEDTESVNKVIQDFANARLLVTNDTGQVEVSHEALIRGWPRLRGWLDEDRNALHTHRRITEAAQAWQSLQRDDGALYRGALLEQANEWRNHHEASLNPLERDFLDASMALQRRAVEEQEARQRRDLEQAQAVAEAERQRAAEQERRAEAEQQRAEIETRARKRLRLSVVLLAALFLSAVMASWFAIERQQQAEELRRLAEEAKQSALEERDKSTAATQAAQANESRALAALSETALKNNRNRSAYKTWLATGTRCGVRSGHGTISSPTIGPLGSHPA